MRFQLLKEKIPNNQLDIDASYAAFQKSTGKNDPEAFLEHLKDQGKISATLFCEIHAAEEISVSHFDGSIVSEALKSIQDPQSTEVPDDGQTLLDGMMASVKARNQTATARYAFLGCLGKGAMGEVHIARDVDLRRKVAFKRMIPRVSKNEKMLSRFFSEVQVTSQLDHPNILPVYGIEVAPNGSLGYSMKLVQGKSLSDLISEAKEASLKDPSTETDELPRRLDHFLKVCDAIAYAHAKGVLHRDLKPDNIMIGLYHQVYVVDWGICRIIGSKDPEADQLVGESQSNDAISRTQVGAVLGTPRYMSPEQAAGKNDELEQRSDLYSLGLILYEIVCLQPAVNGRSVNEVLMKAFEGNKDPIAHANPKQKIPIELKAIIDKATQPKPADRYPDVATLADDVRRFMHGDETIAAPDKGVQKILRFISRHRMETFLALIFVILAGVIASLSILQYEHQVLQEETEHDRRIEQLASDVSKQSHKIDSYLGHCELLVESLAGRASEILTRVSNTGAQPYFSEDFENPKLRPSDTVNSAYFKTDVSFEELVFKLAPGVSKDTVAQQVQNLMLLQNPMKYAMLNSLPEAQNIELTPAKDLNHYLKTIADKGAPMHRVFVALESGILAAYPGYDGYADDYDPRKRPYYSVAAHKWDVHWSEPYTDSVNQDLLLITCATSIYDDNEKFLGVTGAEFTFDYISTELIDLPNAPYEQESFLVNEKGTVIIHSVPSNKHQTKAMLSQPLPFNAVRDAIIQNKGEGHYEDDNVTISYAPIYELGWYYVVVAKNNILFRHE